MQAEAVRNELLDSLYHILELEAFSTLDDFLQGETLLLRELALRQGPVCPSDLSDLVHLSRPRITAALAALRRKGLVRTKPSQEDRRRVEVTITPAGMALIGEKVGQLNAYFDRLVLGLGAEKTYELIRLIDQCVGIMEDPA